MKKAIGFCSHYQAAYRTRERERLAQLHPPPMTHGSYPWPQRSVCVHLCACTFSFLTKHGLLSSNSGIKSAKMINIIPMRLSNLPKQMLKATMYCSWPLYLVYFDLKLKIIYHKVILQEVTPQHWLKKYEGFPALQGITTIIFPAVWHCLILSFHRLKKYMSAFRCMTNIHKQMTWEKGCQLFR